MFHIYIETPNVADWISIIIASLSLIITGIGLFLGWKALQQWRYEKRWDILIEAKAKADHFFDLLQFRYGPYPSFIRTFSRSKLDQAIKDKDRHAIHFFQDIQDQDMRFSNSIDTFRELHEKIKTLRLEPNDAIFEFYNQVSKLINNSQIIHYKEGQLHRGDRSDHLVLPEGFTWEYDSKKIREDIDNLFSKYIEARPILWKLLMRVRLYDL